MAMIKNKASKDSFRTLVNALSERFNNIKIPYKGSFTICFAHNLYGDLSKGIYPKVSDCSKKKLKKVNGRMLNVWGYTGSNVKSLFYLVHLPSGNIVYETCLEAVAQQVLSHFVTALPNFLRSMKMGSPIRYKYNYTALMQTIKSFRPIVPSNYFASGLNALGELIQFTNRGTNIGLAATSYDKKNRKHRILIKKRLKQFATSLSKGTHPRQKEIPLIFVDSGAFGVGKAQMGYVKEVNDAIKEGKPTPPKHPDLNFDEVLDIYDDLANQGIAEQFFFVAPDVVGDPFATLELIRKYKDRLWYPNLIVALHQTDAMDMIKFDKEVQKILKRDFIRGYPMVKGVTGLESFKKHLRSIRPNRIHFLGMGYLGNYYRPFVEAAICIDSSVEIFLDAVRITALIGRGKDGKPPRILTKYQDEAQADLMNENFRDYIESIILEQTESPFTKREILNMPTTLTYESSDEFMQNGDLNALFSDSDILSLLDQSDFDYPNTLPPKEALNYILERLERGKIIKRKDIPQAKKLLGFMKQRLNALALIDFDLFLQLWSEWRESLGGLPWYDDYTYALVDNLAAEAYNRKLKAISKEVADREFFQEKKRRALEKLTDKQLGLLGIKVFK